MKRVLSANLAPLRTSGNRIINGVTGAPVVLRGVNRSGLEYCGPDEQGFLSGAAISRAEIQFIVQQWHCTIIRVPINQDFVLSGRNGRTGEEYQQALDQVIYWASLFGAYTLLDLQWLDSERIYGGNRNFVAPLPNLGSIELGPHSRGVTKMNRRCFTTCSMNRTIVCRTIPGPSPSRTAPPTRPANTRSR